MNPKLLFVSMMQSMMVFPGHVGTYVLQLLSTSSPSSHISTCQALVCEARKEGHSNLKAPGLATAGLPHRTLGLSLARGLVGRV